MPMKNLLLTLFLLSASIHAFSQATMLRRQLDDGPLPERLDILSGRVSDSLHTAQQPLSRKDAVQYLEQYLSHHEAELSAKEKEEIAAFIAKNSEWVSAGNGAQDAKHPVFHTFYRKKTDLIHYNKNGNAFILNPIVAYQQMAEQGNTGQNLFYNARGLEARGTLLRKVSFYTNFTDNQERGPLHHQRYVAQNSAVPGANYYKDFKPEKPGRANDYLLATGYLDAELLKNSIHVTFGHDRLFIGDGYRSLFLGDFGSNYLFLKLNTRLWKLNYQNLFMELTPQYNRGADKLLPRKYAAMHHLSMNVTRWLNIGLFESILFGRQDHFDFQYMNPIILYRSIEQMNGSPDNALLGMNFKINTGIGALLYGQVLLDEFKFAEIRAGKGWWANKYGFQLGAKIANPFGVKNLLLQGEVNMVRPFMYARDSVTNYTHYNMPLAHPFGANFLELATTLRYKPTHRLYLTARGFYNKQGRDTLSNVAFGGDIRDNYNRRNASYGIRLFNGFPTQTLFGNLNIAYELRPSLYIDLGANYRNERSTYAGNPSGQSVQVYGGFRLNAVRRMYDY